MKKVTTLLIIFTLSALLYNIPQIFAQEPNLLKADSLYKEGLRLSEALEFEEAQRVIKIAIETYEAKANLSNDSIQIRLLNMRVTMAQYYTKTQSANVSSEEYQKALRTARKHFGETRLIPEMSLCYAGLLNLSLNDREIATQYQDILLQMINQFNLHSVDFMSCFSSLSKYYLSIEHHQKAMEYAEKGITLLDSTKMNSWYGLSLLYNLKGLAQLNHHIDYPNKKPQYQEAMVSFRKSLNYLHQIKTHNQFSDSLKKWAATYTGVLNSNIGITYGEMLSTKYNNPDTLLLKSYYDSAVHYIDMSIRESILSKNTNTLVHFYRMRAAYEHSYYKDKINYDLNLEWIQGSLYANLAQAGGFDKEEGGYLNNPDPNKVETSKVLSDFELLTALDMKVFHFVQLFRQTQDTLYLNKAVQTQQVQNELFNKFYQSKTTLKDKVAFIRRGMTHHSSNPLYLALLERAATAKERRDMMEKLFESVENSKELILVNQRSSEEAKKQIPQATLQILRNLQQSIIQKEIALNKSETVDANTINSRETVIRDTKALREITAQLEDKLQPLIDSNVLNRRISIADIQTQLDKETAVISYLESSILQNHQYELICFVITKDTATLINLKPVSDFLPSKFNKICSRAKLLIQSKGIDDFFEYSIELYQALVAPVEPYLTGIKQLIIINNRLTEKFPMQLLIREHPASYKKSKKEKNYQNFSSFYKEADYLLKRYAISQYPSATLAFAQESHNTKDVYLHPYLAVAPFTERDEKISDGNMLIVQQMYERSSNNLPSGEQEGLRTIDIGQGVFKSLVGSKEEAKSARFFQNPKVLLDKDASEANTRQAMYSSKIIHLITHSYANIHNPDFAFLALSQPNTINGTDNDGLLFASEIAQDRYSADLAVLSSCESGVGYYLANSGMWSLGYYFMQAGVPNVVFTHWRIADLPTAKLMQYFFEYASQGMLYTLALQMAQLKYLEEAQAEEASPYYWGSFTANTKFKHWTK